MASAQAVAKRAGKSEAAGKPAAQGPLDLADKHVQNDILHPKTVELKLLGDTVKLHPLPAKWALKFAGFSIRVFGAADTTGYGDAVMRVGSVLAERFIDDFLPYVARSVHATDAIVTDAELAPFIKEIDDKLNASAFVEFAKTFLSMTDLNKTVESIRGSFGNQDAKN